MSEQYSEKAQAERRVAERERVRAEAAAVSHRMPWPLTMAQYRLCQLMVWLSSPEDWGPPNPCPHVLSIGIDDTPLGPDKVWCCHECGAVTS